MIAIFYIKWHGLYKLFLEYRDQITAKSAILFRLDHGFQFAVIMDTKKSSNWKSNETAVAYPRLHISPITIIEIIKMKINNRRKKREKRDHHQLQ